MAVYVDQLFQWPIDAITNEQARKLAIRNNGWWCHLFSDAEWELHEFAKLIGLKREWAQYAGTPRAHYDLTPGKRMIAIKFKAIEIRARLEDGTIVPLPQVHKPAKIDPQATLFTR